MCRYSDSFNDETFGCSEDCNCKSFYLLRLHACFLFYVFQVPHSRRDSDSLNDETFGSSEDNSEDRAEEERKRRGNLFSPFRLERP